MSISVTHVASGKEKKDMSRHYDPISVEKIESRPKIVERTFQEHNRGFCWRRCGEWTNGKDAGYVPDGESRNIIS